MPEHLAFTNQLVSLAAKELSLEEKNSLSLIISVLFNDLDLGHSCSILQDDTANLCAEDQIELLLKSNLACEYSNFPLELRPLPISILNVNNKQLVYITKYLQYELDILSKIQSISDANEENAASQIMPVQSITLLEQLSTKYDIPNKEQLKAISNSINHKFSIITGGPGTGKTTTVAILLWMLYQSYGDNLKVKVCAPTGKASKRVKDSIQNSINNSRLKDLDFSQTQSLLESSNNFLTIHKLLGYQANSIYFKHNRNNPLDLDVLIVDESSMVSLPLFSKLLQAIDTNKIKHVILLGDKNQLSSVEEGYVFASLVNAPNIGKHVTSLVTSNRSNMDIGNLANVVQAEDIVEFNLLLRDSRLHGNDKNSAPTCHPRAGGDLLKNNANSTNIKSYKAKLSDLFDKQLFAKLDNSLSQYFKYIMQADLTDIRQLFEEFNRQIVLCLANVGLFGTIYLNAQIEKKVKYMMTDINNNINSAEVAYDLFTVNEVPKTLISQYSNEWYTGRPIIILENDYSLELFNGDIGICIVADGKPHVVFENGRKFIPEILPKYQVAYAITIHKSQGSEYEHVNLVLCDNSGIDGMNELLSKELVYTGITRAKTSVSIFAGDKVLSHAIGNKTLRNTGLDLML